MSPVYLEICRITTTVFKSTISLRSIIELTTSDAYVYDGRFFVHKQWPTCIGIQQRAVKILIDAYE